MSGEPQQPRTAADIQADIDKGQDQMDSMQAMLEAFGADPESEPAPVADPVAEEDEDGFIVIPREPDSEPEPDADGFVPIPRDPGVSAPSAPMGTTHSSLEEDFMDLSVEAAMEEQKVKEYINGGTILYTKKGKKVVITEDAGDGMVRVKFLETGTPMAMNFEALSEEEPEGLEQQTRIDQLRKSGETVYTSSGKAAKVISDEGDGMVRVEFVESGRAMAISIDSLTEQAPAENPDEANIQDWIKDQTVVYTKDGFIGTIAGMGEGNGSVPVRGLDGVLLGAQIPLEELSAKPPYEEMEKSVSGLYVDFQNAYEQDIQGRGIVGRVGERLKSWWHGSTKGTQVEKSFMSAETRQVYDDYLKKRYQLDSLKSHILHGKLGDQFTQTEKERITDKYKKISRALERIKEEQGMLRALRREAMAERQQTAVGKGLDTAKKFTGLAALGRKWNSLSPTQKKWTARGLAVGTSVVLVASGIGSATALAGGLVGGGATRWTLGKMRLFRDEDFYENKARGYLDKAQATTDDEKRNGLYEKADEARWDKRESVLDSSLAYDKDTDTDILHEIDLMHVHNKLNSIHGWDVWRRRARTILSVAAGVGSALGANAATTALDVPSLGEISQRVRESVPRVDAPTVGDIAETAREKVVDPLRDRAEQWFGAGEGKGVSDPSFIHETDSQYIISPEALPGAKAIGITNGEPVAAAILDADGNRVGAFMANESGMVVLDKHAGWEQPMDLSGGQVELKEGYTMHYDLGGEQKTFAGADASSQDSLPAESQSTSVGQSQDSTQGGAAGSTDQAAAAQQPASQQGASGGGLDVEVTSPEKQAIFEQKEIVRKGWYDNQTAGFDLNEQKLEWGGADHTGIVEIDGKKFYELDINDMVAGESTRIGGETANLDNAEAIITDANGTTHVAKFVGGKVQVPADADLASLFGESNGQAYLKDGMIEVAEPTPGGEDYKIIATLEPGSAPSGGGFAAAKASGAGGSADLESLIDGSGDAVADAGGTDHDLESLIDGSKDTAADAGDATQDLESLISGGDSGADAAAASTTTVEVNHEHAGPGKAMPYIKEVSHYNDGLIDNRWQQSVGAHTQPTADQIHRALYGMDGTHEPPDPSHVALDRANVTSGDYQQFKTQGSTVMSPESQNPPNAPAYHQSDLGGWDARDATIKGQKLNSLPGMEGREATFGAPINSPSAGDRGFSVGVDENGINIGTQHNPLDNTLRDRQPWDMNQGIQNDPLNQTPELQNNPLRNATDQMLNRQGINRGGFGIIGDAGASGVNGALDQVPVDQPVPADPIASAAETKSSQPSLYDVLWDALFGGSA